MELSRFKNTVELYNTEKECKLFIDENMYEEVYNALNKESGVAMFPYLIDNKLVMLYGFTNLDLIEVYEKTLAHSKLQGHRLIKRDKLINLVANRVKFGHLLPKSEGILKLVRYCIDNNIITNCSELKLPKYVKVDDYLAKDILIQDRLSLIHFCSEGEISLCGKRYSACQLKSKTEGEFDVFGINNSLQVLDNTTVLGYLLRYKDDIDNSCKTLLKLILETTSTDKQIPKLKVDLHKGLHMYRLIQHTELGKLSQLDFYKCLVDIETLKVSNVVRESPNLYVLGKLHFVLKSLGVPVKIIKLLKTLNVTEDGYNFTCKQIKKVFTSAYDLSLFVRMYNEEHIIPKLYIDSSNNKYKYDCTTLSEDTVPFLIDVAGKIVTMYACYSRNDFETLKGLDTVNSVHVDYDNITLENIILNSVNNIDKCPLKLAICATYVKLAHLGKVRNNLMLDKSKQMNIAPRNLFEFLRTHDTSNIHRKKGHVYIRCNAPCKIKNIENIVKYDEILNMYYTIFKFKTNSWIGIDNVINLMEIVREFEKSGEFNNNCEKLFNRLTVNLYSYKINERTRNKEMSSLIGLYNIGRINKHSNNLIDLMDKAIKMSNNSELFHNIEKLLAV